MTLKQEGFARTGHPLRMLHVLKAGSQPEAGRPAALAQPTPGCGRARGPERQPTAAPSPVSHPPLYYHRSRALGGSNAVSVTERL